MRREYYPLELKSREERRTVVSMLQNTSWQFKVNSLFLLIAVILNTMLIISIPTSPGSSFYFNMINEVLGLWPWQSQCPGENVIYVYGYEFGFKATFHLNFWLITLLIGLGLSNTIVKDNAEVKKTNRLFFAIIGIILVTGFIKILTMLNVNYYNSYRTNIILTSYLMIYPLLLVLPFIIIQLGFKMGVKELIKVNWVKSTKWKGMIIAVISGLILYIIAIALTYLWVETII